MLFDQERINDLIKFGEEIQKREDKMTDIRVRDWMNLDTKASKTLRLLIEAEDMLMDFDDYQMGNDQYYSDFEELYNRISNVRNDFANYIDNHKELLTMDKEIDDYFDEKSISDNNLL